MFFLCPSSLCAAPPRKPATVPPRDEIWYGAETQESDGPVKHLRGAAYLNTSEMKISADEIDYDDDTAWAHARGHVKLEHYESGDVINADHAEYNLRTEEGRFYVVSGTSPAKIMTSPGILTTTNPFAFQAAWAERIKNRYVLHKGFVTDCKMPKPWWIMQAPLFDVIPGDRAIARHAVFRLHNFPIFYLPYFYRPLGKNPRQSGFLTPNIGHSSQYGYLYGLGYYWAMNRSYDMTGIVRDFSARGPAILYDFRGKPTEHTDFNFILYDVDDQGLPQSNGTRLKEGGLEYEITGSTTDLLGFHGSVDYNYLSSFIFRQAFSYSFATAVYNEVDSVGFLQRRFDDGEFTVNFSMHRNQDYVATTFIGQPQNEVVVQKLPTLDSTGRDLQIVNGPIPVWFSYDSSAGLLTRDEPTGTESTGPPASVFHSGEVGRMDLAPHFFSELHIGGFAIEPAVTVEGDDYTNSYALNTTTYGAIQPCSGYSACPPTPTTTVALADSNLFRRDVDVTLDIRSPVLERIFHPGKRLHLGTALKHTVEAELTYQDTSGINQFNRIIHFDSSDLMSDTNQLTGTLVNRLYKKDGKGNVSEILTWRLSQARYFDPTFGGIAVQGQRIVTVATQEISPYAFLDGPRGYSPAISSLNFSPGLFGFEWHAEYDPRRNRMTVNGYSANVRKAKYFASVGETSITTDPLLFPQSNQISFGGGYGSTNRKGWNVTGTELYDVLLHRGVFQFLTGTYNTDCCGFGIQYRRINFGIRDENQYLFSFSLANLGTFGSLPKQSERF